MKYAEFYADWSSRINHLELLRHGLFAIHVASLGYLAINTPNPAFAMWATHTASLWWLAFSAFWLFCIGMAQYNLFRKTILVATQLMRIEHMNELASNKLGYYSGRAGKDNRRGFVLYGAMPEVLSASWYLVVAATAHELSRILTFWASIAGSMIFIGIAVWAFRCHMEILTRKDKEDEEHSPKVAID